MSWTIPCEVDIHHGNSMVEKGKGQNVRLRGINNLDLVGL